MQQNLIRNFRRAWTLRRWRVALSTAALSALQLFPAWTLVVVALASTESAAHEPPHTSA